VPLFEPPWALPAPALEPPLDEPPLFVVEPPDACPEPDEPPLEALVPEPPLPFVVDPPLAPPEPGLPVPADPPDAGLPVLPPLAPPPGLLVLEQATDATVKIARGRPVRRGRDEKRNTEHIKHVISAFASAASRSAKRGVRDNDRENVLQNSGIEKSRQAWNSRECGAPGRKGVPARLKSFRLKEDDLRLLSALAHELGVTETEVVRRGLRALL
jgi:hypothetical protein